MTHPTHHRGRGASFDPPNRFTSLHVQREAWVEATDPAPQTEFLEDRSLNVISTNTSPDVPMDAGINPYRGCEHGCVYCFARPYHEYLGFSAGLEFETKIVVKSRAPELLRKKLASRSWTPQPVMLSGATDPYQPAERRLRLTRRILEVLRDFSNPVAVITKNYLVTRDVDLLGELAEDQAAVVSVSITTLRNEVQRVMEPRTSIPARRLKAIEELASRGVPVSVAVAPVVPGLTDHELPSILASSADAGATAAMFITLRLPHTVSDLFVAWLNQHFPDRKEKVLNRLRELHGGKLYDSTWGTRARGRGHFADQIRELFEVSRRKVGLDSSLPPLSTDAFRRPHNRSGQGELFESGRS